MVAIRKPSVQPLQFVSVPTRRRSPRAAAIRERLIVIVEREVAWLVARDRFRSLESVMEATGYLSNRSTHTSSALGAAIIALAHAIETDWLTSTAHVSVFERTFNRTNREDEQWDASKPHRPGRWERADAAADKAINDAGARLEVA